MLYDIAFFIFSVFYIPTLIFKGKLHKDFLERFGEYSDAKEEALWTAKDVIWIQAVSVGEVVLCKSLIPLLKKEFPGRSIVFSTITKTGNDLAKKLFSNDAIVIYFPLDFSLVVKSVVAKIRPKLYIMVETEIWPNVLKELARKDVPAILINGRISDRSFGKYKLAKSFLKATLDNIKLFCMQSDIDADRIKALGAAADRVRVTGTMKFDADVIMPVAAGKTVKDIFGIKDGREVFVAGSTHGPEEEALISAYKELIQDFPLLALLIAPRHVERTADIEGVARRLGFEPVRLTGSSASCGSVSMRGKVYILDQIGHLNEAYSIATLVFIGGSLIPHGGQNPIEPAVFGKPVLFGPYMFNFKTVASALLKGSGAVRVSDAKELLEKARFLLKDKMARESLGEGAKKVISENRGASARSLEAIKELAHG